MTDQGYNSLDNAVNVDWSKAKCDKYDYMIAAFCGGVAGLIDVFFVGDPMSSVLGKGVDNVADGFVKKAAQFFWKNDHRETRQGKSKKMPQSLDQCISYLEQAFPVNYDARYAKDLMGSDGALGGMRPSNHHLLSLSHSPDPIGLIFSIIDQFSGYGTFIDKGKIIHLVPIKTPENVPWTYHLQGSSLPSMLFCGFVNWLGHLISDLVGSSSTRKPGKTGRGMGIPMPFYELFMFCDFGDFDGRTFADVMVKVFEEGYDLRFGATMAIPVVLEELMIKSIWMIRQKFIRKNSWKDSLPTSKHADLRIMLIVGNATFCLIDGTDAAVHGIVKGNIVSFICHLNFVGWARLVLLVLKELRLRYGSVIDEAIRQFVDDVLCNIQTPAEKERIQQFISRMETYDRHLAELFAEFVASVEKEYRELYLAIDMTFNDTQIMKIRADNSIKLAEVSGVDESRIVKSRKDLDDLFS